MAVFQRVVLMSQEGQAASVLARAWARGLHVPLETISLREGEATAAPGFRANRRLGRSLTLRRLVPRDLKITENYGGASSMDLLICGQEVPTEQKKYLLRETHRDGGPALLFCSKTAPLPSRILLIDQGGPSSDQLMEITIHLCEIFRARLVVLTVARTEHSARERHRQARETFKGSTVSVNFDFLAGADVRSAAASVARWRRCQLVVLEANSAWGRWLGFHSGSWITELLESFSFLVFPAECHL